MAQFFEIRWWQRYLKGREVGQYLADKKVYWHRQLEAIAPEVIVTPGDSVLDMGCGPSGIYTVLPENEVVAVDPLLDSYAEQLAIFNKSNYPKTEFVTATIEHFNTARQFDVVFCMNAINHVSDIKAGFQKLAALCKPGGKLIVTIDAHNHGWLKAIFRLGPGDVLHPHQYDKQEYINFLKDNGLKVIKEVCLKQEPIFNHYLLVAVK